MVNFCHFDDFAQLEGNGTVLSARFETVTQHQDFMYNLSIYWFFSVMLFYYEVFVSILLRILPF